MAMPYVQLMRERERERERERKEREIFYFKMRAIDLLTFCCCLHIYMYIFEIILKTFCKFTSKFLIVGTHEGELQWLCLMFNWWEREREREREKGKRELNFIIDRVVEDGSITGAWALEDLTPTLTPPPKYYPSFRSVFSTYIFYLLLNGLQPIMCNGIKLKPQNNVSENVHPHCI